MTKMRSTKPKPYAATIAMWLRDNLGPCLGGLTGQDWPALKAAVQIVELWCSADHTGKVHAANAFQCVVNAMQPNLRYLAFHAIAHVGSWSHREQLWQQAGLPVLQRIPRCKFE
jgi:hypothetical protein